MKIGTKFGKVSIADEPTYTFGSVDNTIMYPVELQRPAGEIANTAHGVWIEEAPVAIFGTSRGATGVHEHTAIVHNERLYLAVGDCVACLDLRTRVVLWLRTVDWATCFGVHYSLPHDALISHGELEVARLTTDGEIVWHSGGRDIFTGPLSLKTDYVEAIDFDDRKYRFDYGTGACL